MTKPDGPPSRPSDEEVKAYFDGPLKDLRCPVCDHDEFAISTDPETNETALILRRSDGEWSAPPKYLAAVAVVCLKCGDIRLFAMKVIRDWIDKRKGIARG